MVAFLLGVLITLENVILLCLVLIFLRLARVDREKEAEAHVQEAMDEAAEVEARRSRDRDEGFDNLMGYTVNLGRGRSTGGEP